MRSDWPAGLFDACEQPHRPKAATAMMINAVFKRFIETRLLVTARRAARSVGDTAGRRVRMGWRKLRPRRGPPMGPPRARGNGETEARPFTQSAPSLEALESMS